MMTINLDARWAEVLARLPESGMGYQIVRVRLKDGRTLEHATVLNAQILQIHEDVTPFSASEIALIELE